MQLAKARREAKRKQDQHAICIAIWLLGGLAISALTDGNIASFGISLVIAAIYAYGIHKGN